MSDVDANSGPADVSIGYSAACDAWVFWETEYPEDMIIGPFDNEAACREGVEDFYKVNNPFGSGSTEYEITHVSRRFAKETP